jgi:hypothetical protein
LPRSTVDELRAELAESRAQMLAAVTGLAEEQFRHTADGETWNIAAHLSHLLRIERLQAERATLALREIEPFVNSTGTTNDDDPALAQHLAVPQIIHGLQASRRDIEALLDAGEASLSRAIVHWRKGRMTVEAIVRELSKHEREHTVDVVFLARQAQSARRVTIPLTARS